MVMLYNGTDSEGVWGVGGLGGSMLWSCFTMDHPEASPFESSKADLSRVKVDRTEGV